MITKEIVLELTQEEVNSPEPIEIRLIVNVMGTDEDIVYTIIYSKELVT